MRTDSMYLHVVAVLFACAAVGSIAAETAAPAEEWVSLAPTADPQSLRAAVEKTGKVVLGLAPEGKLIVGSTASPGAAAANVSTLAETGPLGLGERKPTAEEEAELAARLVQVKSVAPNELSLMRARLELSDTLPTAVDNSMSQYFPPIRSQSWQGNCTGFTSCYYYNTYTQARDEGLNPASGDDSQICSPAFLYPLANGGSDSGAVLAGMMAYLNDVGCSSWAMKPYEVGDYTSWPTEAAWIDAIPRRTQTSYQIGTISSGCTDADLLAIKQHLANGNVAATRADMYENWYGTNYVEQTGGVSNWVLYANSGAYWGGHAVTLVGYDDDRWYYDGVTTRTGAFLAANSWGPNYGTTNTGGVNRGFLWIAYDFFKNTPNCFGVAYYNDDRPQYRPRLYAVSGLNHAQRARVMYRGGIGAETAPDWMSYIPIYNQGGIAIAIDDQKRIAVDLTDGIPFISDYQNVSMFTSMAISVSASTTGTISSADFFYDFDGDGGFNKVTSADPVVSVGPGATGYATVSFATDPISISPSSDFVTTGTQGGPFPGSRTYIVSNTGTSALDWTASSTVPWLSISKASGILDAGSTDTVLFSINATADLLAAGPHNGSVIFTDVGTSVAETRAVLLEIIPVAAFAWSTIASPEPVNAPFDVTLTAVDSYGSTVPAFTGTVPIGGYVGGQRSVGNGINAAINPMHTLYQATRQQCIYHSADLGPAGVIKSLSLYVATRPPIPLNNWTIRIKHTTMSTYHWDSQALHGPEGFTTVYQADQTISTAGWFTFNFSTPFSYNGTDNLMIDFSYNNTATAATNGYVRYTNYGDYYSYIAYGNGYGDPLNWVGWALPFPQLAPSTFRCDIKLLVTSPVPITPTVTGNFINGTWSGQVTVLQPANQMFLYADDGFNHSGQSNLFDVVAAPFVQQVTSSLANGAYRAGMTIPISAIFSRPITVTGGTPQLQLETGTVDRIVDLSGTTTDSLAFNYTVQPGDDSADLDFLSSASLDFRGADIRDTQLGVVAGPSLPNPGAAGSLGANKNLVVDTVAPVSQAVVTHDTFAGTTVPIGFIASDSRSGVQHTHLYARSAGASEFLETGATPVGGTSGIVVFSPSADGRYGVCAIAEDMAGNMADMPTNPDANVLFNLGANTPFVHTVQTGNEVLVFPMTDDKDVTVTLTGATVGGTITVTRNVPLAGQPTYFGHPQKLLQESLNVVGDSLGTGWTAGIEWAFDPANAAGMGEPITTVYRFDGGDVPSATYDTGPVGNVLSIPGITGFSDWYAGAAGAVPVRISEFSID